jgi:uncharacterized protein YdcH (DUF465 family)
MKSASIPKSNSRKPFFAAKALLAAAILMTFSTSASAFSDVPAFSQRVLTIAKQIQEYTKQLEQVKADAERYAALKTKIDGLGAELSKLTKMDTDLKERDADSFGMKEKCPGASSIPSLATLMSAFKLNRNADLPQIKKDQQEVCVRIVYAENLRYNESVRSINRMRKQADQLKTIDTRRTAAIGEDESKIDANTNDLSRLISEAATGSQYSNSVIQAYDVYIATLKDNQAMLTKVAMDGNQGDDGLVAAVSRKLVQGAVLKGSLEALAAKDR